MKCGEGTLVNQVKANVNINIYVYVYVYVNFFLRVPRMGYKGLQNDSYR